MLTENFLPIQQAQSTSALSARWKLMPGSAICLHSRKAGVLHIEQGRVWATFDGPHQGHGNEPADHFVQAGQQLALRAGQRLVIEPWCSVREAPVYFAWTPAPAAITVHATRWKTALTQRLQAWGRGLLVL